MPTNISTKQCLSCEIVDGSRQTSGGTIYETETFHAHQDVAYPIPGLVIVAAKRHFKCLDDMTTEEYVSFGIYGYAAVTRKIDEGCVVTTIYPTFSENRHSLVLMEFEPLRLISRSSSK